MDAILSSPKTLKMIRPLLCDPNAKFPHFSALSNHISCASSFGTSRVLGMGLQSSKKVSGRNRERTVSKTWDYVRPRTINAYGRHAQDRVLEEEAPQILETSPPLKVFPGQAFPLGVSKVENGINFAIFSQHATAVVLCLSLPQRMDESMVELKLDPDVNRTGDIWHICVEDLPQSNVLYGYRIDGPRGWHEGHRFDNKIVLIDPYAKLIEGRRFFGDASNKWSRFLGTYDFDSLPFDWGDNYKLPSIPEKDLVIYEMNVRAFTADKSSGLDPNVCGSYLGVIEKVITFALN